MSWIQTVPLNDLGDEPVVFNHPPRQIAVFRIDDRVFAVDNRCPHEGYPLAAGHVSGDCVLTCNWHNWKFRLSDGECLMGGDNVRSYRTRRQDGHLWIDISDPPPEETRRQVLQGLKVAVEERDFGRIYREVARLHYHGLDTRDAILAALEWTHTRWEFGTPHSPAATADWLALADTLNDRFEDRLICLEEAVDHLAVDGLRHREYPYAPAGEPFEHRAFCAAIESEQHRRAEAMVAGGLRDGLHWNDMEEAFAEASLAHYNDFGHSTIYVAKTGQLIEALGVKAERFLMAPLARSISYATREDLIPEFRDYGPALASLPEPGTGPGDGSRPDVPFPMTTPQALAWVGDNIATFGYAPVYDALLEALGLNLLHFDTSYWNGQRPSRQPERRLAGLHSRSDVLERGPQTLHEIPPPLAAGSGADGMFPRSQFRIHRSEYRYRGMARRCTGVVLRRESRSAAGSRSARPDFLGASDQDRRRGPGRMAARLRIVPRCAAGGPEPFPPLPYQDETTCAAWRGRRSPSCRATSNRDPVSATVLGPSFETGQHRDPEYGMRKSEVIEISVSTSRKGAANDTDVVGRLEQNRRQP